MAKKEEANVQFISIPEIKIKTANITIVGESPLLINKFSEKAKREILDKQMKKAKKAKEAKVPFYDFVQSLHWITPMPDFEGKTEEEIKEIFEKAIENGAKFGFPTVGIKQSAISAAYRGGLAKNKVSLQGAFHIKGELAEIVGELTMREDYCKIPMGGADIVYRGEFKEGWTSTFTVMYDESIISLEQIIQMINLGGFSVGIGDWRVEKRWELRYVSLQVRGMKMEIWKDVKGFEGCYEISNFGNIRNFKTKKVLKQSCTITSDRYYVRVKNKHLNVAREVAKVFLEKIEGKDFVNHKDGNKKNNRVENLEWCTRSENEKHAYANNLKKATRGELSGKAKLKWKDIDFIRKDYKPYDRNYSIRALANKYNVSKGTIECIINNKTWKKEVKQ